MKNKQDVRCWQVVKIRNLKNMIFGWVWQVDVFGRYVLILELLYWRYIVWTTGRSGPQVSAVRAFGIWAGFMSESRGEHWDNRSRRGIK